MRPLRRGAIALAGLLILVVAAGFLPNEPIRRSIESRMNRSLRGYSARIGGARLQPLGFALTLENVVLRQKEHPEPAILVVPRLQARVQWRELVFLRVVADFLVTRPRGYVNLRQLRAEAEDAVPVKDKGWQQAVEAIYPLRINELRVEDGELTYIDADRSRPLRLTHWNVRASNIRNIHSRQRTYPSPVETSAVVFGSGRADLKGDADFLAEPFAGVKGRFHLTGIPLDDLRPVAAHWNVLVTGGTLTTAGEVEYAPSVRRLRLPEIRVAGARIGYERKPRADSRPATVPLREKQNSESSVPAWSLSLDRFRLTDSELELIDRTRATAYRLFVSRVSADVEGLSTEPPGHKARASLRGEFMGASDLIAGVEFQPGSRRADLDVKVEVAPTPMTKLNDLFRAWGRFDVAAGEFQLFSEVRVHDGSMRGYVKPIFRHVEIYDSRQDARKGLLRKVYENVVDVASNILKNHARDQVATTVPIQGPIGDARSNLWDVLGGLLENAFVRAILPGFDQQVGGLRPRK